MYKHSAQRVTSAFITLAILAGALLFFRDVALGITPAVDTGKTTYLLGENVPLSGSIAFNQGEVLPITQVTLDISGPQSVQQILPISPGHYDFTDSRLSLDVLWQNIGFGYGYGYSYKGLGSPSSITYDITWDAPILKDPAPVFSLIPQTTLAFNIPAVAPAPTPTPGGPVDLPAVTQLFPIPQVAVPGPAPGAPAVLPTVTEAFSIPQISVPQADPGAPAELPTVTQSFAVPQIPVPQPPQGVPELDASPNTALAFDLPTQQMPQGLASDGTDFYVVVDGVNPGDPDQIQKLDSSGALLSTIPAPSAQVDGIAYLGGFLWVADNQDLGSGKRIRKLDPTNGNVLSSFTPPNQWDEYGGIGVSGTSLWLAQKNGCGLSKVTQTGSQQQQVFTPCDPHDFQGVIESGGFLYTVYGSKVQKWNTNGQEMQNWNTTLTSLTGSQFLNSVFYLLDADTTAVYKTAIPSGITISTDPLGIAHDGTNIWLLIDATPFDKIAKIDPANGSLVTSYDSPGANSEGITYLNGFLWVSTYDDNQRKVHKINPSTGAATTSINIPGGQSPGDLSNTGTNLVSVNKNDNWDVKVFNTSGVEQLSENIDNSSKTGAAGLAYDNPNTRAFIAKDGTIMQVNAQFNVQQTWNPTLTDIQGLAYYSSVLYVADAGTDIIYKASIPTGISVTTNPLGVAHDGTNIWLLVDASPVDKIAKVDPSTGTLLASYDAPGANTEGITYLSSYLWVVINSQGSKIYKIDPANGTSSANFNVPCCIGEIGGLSNDGANLVAVEKFNNQVKVFDTQGNQQQEVWVDGSSQSGTTGLAYDASDSRAFIAKNGVVMKVDSAQFDVQQTWNTTLTDIQGQTYHSSVLFMADAGTDKVYKASIPSGISVTVNPRGMTYDGTNLYILVDGTPADKILKVNPSTGALLDSFNASSNQADAIVYLGGQLYVAVNQDNPCCSRNIVVHNSTTGAQVTNFSPPGGDDVKGLTSNGTSLLSGPKWGANVQVFDASGIGQSQFWLDGMDGVEALTYYASTDQLYALKGNKIRRYSANGGTSLQQWTTTLATVNGATFVGQFLYMADATTDTIYAASIPTPPVVLTTTPKGMASDGTNLYILVEASPKDKVLKVNTSGTLLGSFDAPANNTDGIDYLGGYLYISVNENLSGGCCGFQPTIFKVNKDTGATVTSFQINNVWDSITALANDGTNLIVGMQMGGGWRLVDPANPSAVQEKWQNGAGFPWMEGFQSFAYALGNLYGANGNQLNKFNKDNGNTQDSWFLQGGSMSVKGLAYIGTTLYLADASGNAVRATTFPANIPELTIAGNYNAKLVVQTSGQTLESSLAPFAIAKNTQVVVNITEPQNGFSSFTPAVDIAGNVNDPSITQVNVGVDLPFTTLFDDSVQKPASEAKWNANGLWNIACQDSQDQFFPKTHTFPCTWYYGNKATQNYETGAANSGDLQLVGPNTGGTFTVGAGTNMSFWTWWDTEPGADFDRKQLQVSADGGSTWQTIAMILPPFEIDFSTGKPFNTPPALQGQNIQWIPVPQAHFEFKGGPCPPNCGFPAGSGGGKPVFDPVNIDLNAFTGQNILVRFHFETVDASVNALEGWYIDDVKIGGAGFQGVVAQVTPVTDPALLSQGIFGTYATVFNLAEGINTITASAATSYDSSLKDTAEITGFLDTTPPLVTLNPITSPTKTPSATLSGSIQDVNFDQLVITHTTVLGSKTIITLKELPANNTFSKSVSLVEGLNTFEATATDGAGLSGSATISVVLDTTGPVLTVLNPSYPIGVMSARPNDPVIFNIDAADEGSGVQWVQIVYPGGPGGQPQTGGFIPSGDIPEAIRDLWNATGDWVLPVRVPVTAPPGSFSLTVRAYDNAGNQTVGTVTATVVPSLEAFAIDLMPNWNLVSLPLIPDTANMGTLTAGIPGIDAIWYYDATLTDLPPEDRWLLYTPNPDDVDTLTTLATGRGYWIMMNPSAFQLSAPLGPGLPQTPKPIQFAYTGSFLQPGSLPPAYTVTAGWNSIGFHSETALPVTTALQTLESPVRIWGSLFQYNNRIVFELPDDPTEEPVFEILLGSFQRLLATDSMTSGFGYWVYMVDNGVIVP